jgi:hypothetical protein
MSEIPFLKGRKSLVFLAGREFLVLSQQKQIFCNPVNRSLFLGKNQIPDRGAEPVIIPALPEDASSRLSCPIRILSIYLDRISLLLLPEAKASKKQHL